MDTYRNENRGPTHAWVLRMKLNFFSRCELNLIKCLKELAPGTILTPSACTSVRF